MKRVGPGRAGWPFWFGEAVSQLRRTPSHPLGARPRPPSARGIPPIVYLYHAGCGRSGVPAVFPVAPCCTAVSPVHVHVLPCTRVCLCVCVRARAARVARVYLCVRVCVCVSVHVCMYTGAMTHNRLGPPAQGSRAPFGVATSAPSSPVLQTRRLMHRGASLDAGSSGLGTGGSPLGRPALDPLVTGPGGRARPALAPIGRAGSPLVASLSAGASPLSSSGGASPPQWGGSGGT
jgi:hypothetical protein